MINCLNHFEILTTHSGKLLRYFINGFQFNLVNAQKCAKSGHNQYLINSNEINLVLTSLNNEPLIDSNEIKKKRDIIYSSSPLPASSLLSIQRNDPLLFESIQARQNGVYNVAFKVRDLDRILFNCKKHKVKVIENNPENVIIRSAIDGVAHSLYQQPHQNHQSEFNANSKSNETFATHFDHLTYAVHANQSREVIQWYQNIFGMKSLKPKGQSEEEEDQGMIVKTGTSGMNIKAIKYWLCAETGVHLDDQDVNYNNRANFKLVIAEPLHPDAAENEEDNDNEKNQKKNQISIFLEENGGPGVQHIGLHTDDIVKSVEQTKRECGTGFMDYYATPDSYYESKNKIEEIKNCGLNVELLKKNHILLDADQKSKSKEPEQESESNYKSYLLQVFTLPLFDKNTLFLELIQRVGGVQGFGGANIRALWDAVQLKINDSDKDKDNKKSSNNLDVDDSDEQVNAKQIRSENKN